MSAQLFTQQSEAGDDGLYILTVAWAIHLETTVGCHCTLFDFNQLQISGPIQEGARYDFLDLQGFAVMLPSPINWFKKSCSIKPRQLQTES